MPDKSFVHLHVHTEYSMLDGAAKIEPLFVEAQRLGMPAVAITDHGNLFGAYEFHQAASRAGIKPIIGVEAYLAPGSRLHKAPVLWSDGTKNRSNTDGSRFDVGGGGAYTHMTMLATNATGLRNLFKLSTRASFEGRYGKYPRMDRDLLAEHSDGIIATTGCLGGEVSTRLGLGQFGEAVKAAGEFRDIFGRDNFFLEVMDHNIAFERSLRDQLLDVGRKVGLKPLATNDSHYVTADQADTHDVLLCVQTGRQADDPKRFRFDGHGYHLKSPQDMRAYWDTELPGAADNTLLVAERVTSYDDVFAFVDRMPRVPVPEGKTENDLLRELVEQGVEERFPFGITSQYRDRIEWELAIIAQMGFPGYFLVVSDLMKWARQRGIRVGPGRGSGGGSLIAYLTWITDLDPIEHNLLFERFLNPERVSPPDIDLDFDERRRGEVMDYVIGKWGAENVAQVVTFGRIKTKAAIKDAARVLFGQSGYQLADKITKALPPPRDAKDIPLSGIFDPEHPRYMEASEVRSLAASDAIYARILDTARGLEGLIRNTGVHACAVILSSQPLIDVVPLWKRASDDAIITGWDMGACESVGLLKMDFLGLSNLTIIDKAIKAIASASATADAVEIDTETLPLDDPKTFELLARGDTLGVFQLDGAGMRDLLRRMKPKRFTDIAAVLALYRPGPMDVDAHIAYAERANGRQEVTPIHPELKDALEPILGETYGLVVYQEQVMAIAQQLAGYTLGGADLLRRAMGKKKKDIMEKEYAKFLAGMAGKGFSETAAKTLWDVLAPFVGYAFNRSHAIGYAKIAYLTGYFKANHPAEFMAALLTVNADDKKKSAVYLGDCRRQGITVLPPDVNASQYEFTAVDGQVRFGLGAVRNVGTSPVQAILDARREHGPFASFPDFMENVGLGACNKKVIESLIKGGAFDSLGHTRLGLIRVYEEAVDAVISLKRKEQDGQFDLFSTCEEVKDDASPLSHLPIRGGEWDRKTLLAHERDMLGLYVSSHPLAGAESLLRKFAPSSIPDVLDRAPREGEVAVAGIIASIDKRTDRNGHPWAIVKIEDLDGGEIDVLFFAKAYLVYGEELTPDSVVAVRGRVNWRDERMSLYGNQLVTLDISTIEQNPIAPIVLRVDARTGPEAIRDLRTVLSAHQGEAPVRILLCKDGNETPLEVDPYRVRVTPGLLAQLRGIRGVTLPA